MINITVIDALMGQGKTRYVFNLMRSYPDQRYIYIGMNLAESASRNTVDLRCFDR